MGAVQKREFFWTGARREWQSFSPGRDRIFSFTLVWDWDRIGLFLWAWEETGMKIHSCVTLLCEWGQQSCVDIVTGSTTVTRFGEHKTTEHTFFLPRHSPFTPTPLFHHSWLPRHFFVTPTSVVCHSLFTSLSLPLYSFLFPLSSLFNLSSLLFHSLSTPLPFPLYSLFAPGVKNGHCLHSLHRVCKNVLLKRMRENQSSVLTNMKKQLSTFEAGIKLLEQSNFACWILD